eukprot:2087248-Amphidinium_carterae.3
MASIQLVLAVIAAFKWEAHQSDFTQAFLQGRPVERLLLIRQPSQGIPGLQPSQLLLLKKEVYGSIAGPSQWRESVVREILRLGWCMTASDPCVFVMKNASMSNANAGLTMEEVMPTETLEQDEKKASRSRLVKEEFVGVKGILLLLTDDLLEAGESEHRDAVDRLITTYKTGRRNSLKDRGGGVFNGRRVCQTAEGGFTLSMHDYVAEKLKPVVVDKTRKGKPDQELNEQERATFRTVLMKLMWVSRQCRPELLGTCTILSSKVTVATIRDLLELGKLVSHLLSTPNLGLTIHPIG